MAGSASVPPASVAAGWGTSWTLITAFEFPAKSQTIRVCAFLRLLRSVADQDLLAHLGLDSDSQSGAPASILASENDALTREIGPAAARPGARSGPDPTS